MKLRESRKCQVSALSGLCTGLYIRPAQSHKIWYETEYLTDVFNPALIYFDGLSPTRVIDANNVQFVYDDVLELTAIVMSNN